VFEKHKILNNQLPDQHLLLFGILEALRAVYTETPIPSKAETLYPSIWLSMTSEYQAFLRFHMVSILHDPTAAANNFPTTEINATTTQLTSNNSLVLTILYHCYKNPISIEYVAKQFQALFSAQQFPDYTQYDQIPGWFQSLSQRLSLFLDFAIYSKSELRRVVLGQQQRAPEFPFRIRDTTPNYMRTFCRALPANAFLAFQLYTGGIFSNPMPDTYSLYTALNASSHRLFQDSELKYSRGTVAFVKHPIHDLSFSFSYNGRVVSLESERSGDYSENIRDFFEFFKSYFCRPRNIRIDSYDSGPSVPPPKPPPDHHRAASPNTSSRPSSDPYPRVSDTEYHRLSPPERSDLSKSQQAWRDRNSPASSSPSRSPQPQSSLRGAASGHSTGDDPYPGIPQAEFLKLSPAERDAQSAKVTEWYKRHPESGRSTKGPRVTFQQPTPIRGSDLSRPGLRKSANAALPTGTSDYLAALANLKLYYEHNHPDFSRFTAAATPAPYIDTDVHASDNDSPAPDSYQEPNLYDHNLYDSADEMNYFDSYDPDAHASNPLFEPEAHPSA